MKKSLYLLLVLFVASSCSTPKEADRVEDRLVLADQSASQGEDLDLAGIDFEEDGSEASEDDEFEITDIDDDSDSFDEFAQDFEDKDLKKSKPNPPSTVAKSDDLGFEDFEDITTPAQTGMGDSAKATDVEESFDSPLVFESEPDLSFEETSGKSNKKTEQETDFGFGSPSSPAEVDQSDEAVFSFDPEPDAEAKNTAWPSDQDSQKSKVVSIDYNAFHSGGSFMVTTSKKADYTTEFIPETNQYVLKLKNTEIMPSLARPFLTKDFRQSFEAMNSYRGDDGSLRLVFQLKPNSDPKVSYLNGALVVEPGLSEGSNLKSNNLAASSNKDAVSLSATSFEDFLLDRSKFVGQPVSLQVKDESVVTIIQFIAEQVGANIVLSSGVTGNISIKLKDVPWDQALVTIMKSKGLGYVRSGNILRVAPLEELQKESLAAAAVQKAKRTLAPFHVKVFPLSYASPEVIEAKIKPFLTAASGENGRAGQVLSEARSSSLIVRDTMDVIENIAALVKELDSAPLQVMIQAKIVEATKNFSKSIKGLSLTSGINSQARGGNVTGNLNFRSVQENGAATFLPEISIGGIDFLGTLSAQLRLQEIDSKAKVLSSPSVMAINNETAVITQSDEILALVRTNDEGGGPATFTIGRTPIELRLEVTPQVSADSNIIMEINVKRQFPVQQSLGEAVNSREAKTKIMIGNNKTAMIGGIYQVLERKSVTGAPVLRKLPLLGWLFKDDLKTKDDTELVIFVTPRVMNQNAVGDNLADQPLRPSRGERVSKYK